VGRIGAAHAQRPRQLTPLPPSPAGRNTFRSAGAKSERYGLPLRHTLQPQYPFHPMRAMGLERHGASLSLSAAPS
jgi:hypothetical protein